MLNEQMKQFKSPGPDFRGAPFWAWNAKLEPEELIRQIRLMKEMGLGGFFMHARVGLNTEYLGKEWFECVKACIAEAEKLGMNAWLYDEDRWPSGSAAGEVTRRHPEYAQQGLDYAFENSPVFGGLAHFALKIQEGGLLDWRRFEQCLRAVRFWKAERLCVWRSAVSVRNWAWM